MSLVITTDRPTGMTEVAHKNALIKAVSPCGMVVDAMVHSLEIRQFAAERRKIADRPSIVRAVGPGYQAKAGRA